MLNLNLLVELDQHYGNLDGYEKKLKLISGHAEYLLLKNKYLKLKDQLLELKDKNQQLIDSIRKETRLLDDDKYRLKEAEENLYNGKVQDIKQLSALEKEKNHLEKTIENNENSILDKMEVAEEMSKDIQVIEESLKEIEVELRKEKSYILKLKAELEQLIEYENTEINRIQRHVDQEILKQYQLVRSKKNKGIGIVINEICNGCHTHVPKTIIDKLKLGKVINTCETCGRILILKEENEET